MKVDYMRPVVCKHCRAQLGTTEGYSWHLPEESEHTNPFECIRSLRLELDRTIESLDYLDRKINRSED